MIELEHGFLGGSQDSSLNYFEITGGSDNNSEKESYHNWEHSAIDLDQYNVLPNGMENDNPKKIQSVTLSNPIASRIQNRKVELLIDQYPYLYQEVEGQRIPVDNPEIKQWLDSFEATDVLIENATNYYYSNMVFTKVFSSKEGRIGTGFSKLENVSSFEAH